MSAKKVEKWSIIRLEEKSFGLLYFNVFWPIIRGYSERFLIFSGIFFALLSSTFTIVLTDNNRVFEILLTFFGTSPNYQGKKKSKTQLFLAQKVEKVAGNKA